MADEKPLSAWQQCRAITQAAMQPEDHEQNVQRARAALLAQLAAMGEKGTKLAERLADSDGPIQVEDGDVPPELMQQLFHPDNA